MNIRHCARVVVLDEHNEVLMLMYEDKQPVDPARPDLLRYWVSPGGGVKDGETHEQAVQRELEEETGIENAKIGPLIWIRERQLLHKREVKSYIERYYVTRVARDRCPMQNRTSDEPIEHQRWWSLADMRASEEIFLPHGFVDLVSPIVVGELPAEPIRITDEI